MNRPHLIDYEDDGKYLEALVRYIDELEEELHNEDYETLRLRLEQQVIETSVECVEKLRQTARAERAEDLNKRAVYGCCEECGVVVDLEKARLALVAIQATTPGSAHRIARQALSERVHCASVNIYTCAECKGHNRCEDEMDAGFGDYGRDDPREDR